MFVSGVVFRTPASTGLGPLYPDRPSYNIINVRRVHRAKKCGTSVWLGGKREESTSINEGDREITGTSGVNRSFFSYKSCVNVCQHTALRVDAPKGAQYRLRQEEGTNRVGLVRRKGPMMARQGTHEEVIQGTTDRNAY